MAYIAVDILEPGSLILMRYGHSRSQYLTERRRVHLNARVLVCIRVRAHEGGAHVRGMLRASGVMGVNGVAAVVGSLPSRLKRRGRKSSGQHTSQYNMCYNHEHMRIRECMNKAVWPGCCRQSFKLAVSVASIGPSG